MGVTKTEIFTEKQKRIADLTNAFSHPARVVILQLLIAYGEAFTVNLIPDFTQCKALTRNQSCCTSTA